MSEAVCLLFSMREKALVPSGLSVRQPGMEAGLPGGNTDPERMEAILLNARQKAAGFVAGIRSGIIAPSPVEESALSPCTYCSCRPVCGLDPLLPDANARVLPKQKLQSVLRNGFEPLEAEERELRIE